MKKSQLMGYILGILLLLYEVNAIAIKLESVIIRFNNDWARCVIEDTNELFCTYSINEKVYRDNDAKDQYLNGERIKGKPLSTQLTIKNIKIGNDTEKQKIFSFLKNNISFPQSRKPDKIIRISPCKIAENVEQIMLMMRLMALVGSDTDTLSCSKVFLNYYQAVARQGTHQFIKDNRLWLKKYFDLEISKQNWLKKNSDLLTANNIEAINLLGKGVQKLSSTKLNALLKYPQALKVINGLTGESTFDLKTFNTKIKKINDLQAVAMFLNKISNTDTGMDQFISALNKPSFIAKIEQIDPSDIACLANNSSNGSCYTTLSKIVKGDYLLYALLIISNLLILLILLRLFFRKKELPSNDSDSLPPANLVTDQDITVPAARPESRNALENIFLLTFLTELKPVMSKFKSADQRDRALKGLERAIQELKKAEERTDMGYDQSKKNQNQMPTTAGENEDLSVEDILNQLLNFDTNELDGFKKLYSSIEAHIRKYLPQILSRYVDSIKPEKQVDSSDKSNNGSPTLIAELKSHLSSTQKLTEALETSIETIKSSEGYENLKSNYEGILSKCGLDYEDGDYTMSHNALIRKIDAYADDQVAMGDIEKAIAMLNTRPENKINISPSSPSEPSYDIEGNFNEPRGLAVSGQKRDIANTIENTLIPDYKAYQSIKKNLKSVFDQCFNINQQDMKIPDFLTSLIEQANRESTWHPLQQEFSGLITDCQNQLNQLSLTDDKKIPEIIEFLKLEENLDSLLEFTKKNDFFDKSEDTAEYLKETIEGMNSTLFKHFFSADDILNTYFSELDNRNFQTLVHYITAISSVLKALLLKAGFQFVSVPLLSEKKDDTKVLGVKVKQVLANTNETVTSLRALLTPEMQDSILNKIKNGQNPVVFIKEYAGLLPKDKNASEVSLTVLVANRNNWK